MTAKTLKIVAGLYRFSLSIDSLWITEAAGHRMILASEKARGECPIMGVVYTTTNTSTIGGNPRGSRTSRDAREPTTLPISGRRAGFYGRNRPLKNVKRRLPAWGTRSRAYQFGFGLPNGCQGVCDDGRWPSYAGFRPHHLCCGHHLTDPAQPTEIHSHG